MYTEYRHRGMGPDDEGAGEGAPMRARCRSQETTSQRQATISQRAPGMVYSCRVCWGYRVDSRPVVMVSGDGGNDGCTALAGLARREKGRDPPARNASMLGGRDVAYSMASNHSVPCPHDYD